jgi:hypothetical protein
VGEGSCAFVAKDTPTFNVVVRRPSLGMRVWQSGCGRTGGHCGAGA